MPRSYYGLVPTRGAASYGGERDTQKQKVYTWEGAIISGGLARNDRHLAR